MILQIDIKKLIECKLPIESYCLLVLLYNNQKELITSYSKLFKFHTEELDMLVKEGYVINKGSSDKYLLSNLQLTNKFETTFSEKQVGLDWIDQWYDLWPKGVKSGGYPLRSGKDDCLKKMIKFTKEFPEYTKGIIIGATSKYLSEMKQKNYAYCKLASYFIFKDGVSTLSGLCEAFNNSVNQPDLDNKEQGKTSLGIKDF